MGKSIAKLLIVIILVAVLIYGAFFDVSIGYFTKAGVFSDSSHIGAVVKGLDLTGGSIITFKADTNDTVTPEQMDTVISIMRSRLDSLGFTEATVRSQGDDKFVVEMPSITDVDEAERLLGQTAQLKFVNADGEEVLNGTDVKKATKKYGQLSQNSAAENYVELEFNKDSVKKFAEATKKAAQAAGDNKNYISIMLDETVVSQPSVSAEYASTGIDSDTAVISGSFTAKSAEELASVINAGQLPFNLKTASKTTVGATLGEKALETSLWAGLWGIIIILLIMLVFYRVAGLAADIALGGYIGLLMLILGLLRANLTLPGIAGLVLSIGMAVDANVIIFERIKEEIVSGKTVKAAINAGFKRAFTSIIDSNITTLIAAVVLYVIGSGTIKGFAITLGLGILVSVFTAVFVTRFIITALSEIFPKKPWLYGVSKKKLATEE